MWLMKIAVELIQRLDENPERKCVARSLAGLINLKGDVQGAVFDVCSVQSHAHV